MKRRERILFQRKSVTFNTYNEPVTTWNNISSTPEVWAEVIPRTSNEDFRDKQKAGFQRYNFTILYRDDLDIEMRISWDGRLWDIKAIETLHKEPRRSKLLITAEWTQGKNFE